MSKKLAPAHGVGDPGWAGWSRHRFYNRTPARRGWALHATRSRAYLDPGTSGRIVVALALVVIIGGAPMWGRNPVLPGPYATPSVMHFPITIGRPSDRGPTAPAGFVVPRWAHGLD